MSVPPVVVGVAGGSGSGKSTVVARLLEALGGRDVSLIHHDSYYRDRSAIPTAEREAINYDHPDALETELLVHHLRELRAGRAVEVPSYDFARHVRAPETTRVEPGRALILDGILLLAEAELRALMDIRVFVDTDADVRLMRRLRRDLRERGRTLESVLDQYEATVRPMHLEFVEPSKRFADVIIPEGGRGEVAVELLAARLRQLLAGPAQRA